MVTLFSSPSPQDFSSADFKKYEASGMCGHHPDYYVVFDDAFSIQQISVDNNGKITEEHVLPLLDDIGYEYMGDEESHFEAI